jgi:hypothetical protein
LELPTTNRKPSDPIVAGIPTLQDLLNADSNSDRPIDEGALFNPADPYGIKDYEEMEEGEMRQIQPLPRSSFVAPASQLSRLRLILISKPQSSPRALLPTREHPSRLLLMVPKIPPRPRPRYGQRRTQSGMPQTGRYKIKYL